jgi:glyoxylase-like metal-dependent hydrolase (beta-lactamase superfamily II)
VRRAIVLLAAAACAAASTIALTAQSRPEGADIRVLPLRGNLYLLAGAGGNVAASVGKDGVLLVNSGSGPKADALLAAVRRLSRHVTAEPAVQRSCVGVADGCTWWNSSELLPTTAGTRAPRPIIGIVNTSDDLDLVGGNAVVAAAGRTFGVRNIDGTLPSAWIVAHENANLRLVGRAPELIANESYGGNEKKLNFVNGEGVVITHIDNAHTDGDSLVYFRGSDVLVAGDILDMTRYPVIDLARGGSINGVVRALNWILDVAVVEHMMEGGTLIVPGHGRMADAADVAYYRDMVTIVRDRVREMIKRGLTLDQIKARRLTRDYDGRFGKSPEWTPDQFVEAVYRSLAPKA